MPAPADTVRPGPDPGPDPDPRPLRLLFVCVGNSCRSQMAEGLARAMGGDRVEARSAGVFPGDRIAPKAVEVMRELGIDISSHEPKALTEESLDWADRSFTMGCDARDMCPAPWLANTDDWRLDDPMGLGLEKYRAVRDEIFWHLRELLEEEGIPVQPSFRPPPAPPPSPPSPSPLTPTPG